MIASWMLYTCVVGAMCVLSAHIAEKALLMIRVPTRGIWVGALGLCAFLSLRACPIFADQAVPYASVLPNLGSERSVADSVASEPSGLSAVATRLGRLPDVITLPGATQVARLDVAFIVLWTLLSTIWLGALALSALRIARERREWERAHVDGTPVWLSHDVGPAVFGLLQYQIVLPSWVAQCTDAERTLVITHEREHASAHDPLLLLGAGVLAALMPWNPASWYALRRIRHAIEIDCDRRVTARHPDPIAYGRLLVAVGERSIVNVMPAAALAERSTLIERRIRQMIRNRPRWIVARGSALIAMSTACIVVACRAPRVIAASTAGPEAGISDVVRADARRLALKGLLRSATDLPAQGFEIVEAGNATSSPCVSRLRDPRDGTLLVMRMSTTFHDEDRLQDGSIVSVKTGFANYLVLPAGQTRASGGRYGVQPKEVLRMRCGNQYVLGIAPDSVGPNTY